jgi:hypothetical protein
MPSHNVYVRGTGITLLSQWNVRENLPNCTLIRLELDDATARRASADSWMHACPIAESRLSSMTT